MAVLPAGTVTFLFTDLEGSTRRWEEHPDAMPGALVRHDEILRGAIEGHGGVVFSEMGDGMAAVFASPVGAVSAALDAQVGLRDESWGEVGPLRARMGLHAGEGVLRSDGQYVNAPLNRCARLMAVAHGGQVVCSDSVEVLVRDGLPPGVSFADLGEHRLRDLAQPVRVFQLCADGLPGEFPRLRSLDAFPGNLPAQLTSFVGREQELAALGNALEASRLVTLVGVGGVGKTRLALQVAAEQIAQFPDGAWVCELASADDRESMLQVVAAALGVRPRPGASLEDSVVDSLRPRRVLVVLDNCEHLLRAAAGLADRVLRECAHAYLVATSRESLGVAGEQTWPLGSLAIPDAADADGLVSDAVRLFVDRAQAARPGFTLTDANAPAVGEICRRLDGIPLALELAAARVSALTPADISGLLDERFRLLAGGRRSGVERHQTLRATVDWSYALLDDRERVVFDRLSVFTGSFDAVAAQAVVAGEGVEAWDVLDALTDLVAKSMVVAEESADQTMRYQLLETLRQYGWERLDAAGDADGWRRRHAEHYATVAEATGAGMRGPDELVWKVRLLADMDNIRAAVSWSLERDDPADVEYALRIVTALANFVVGHAAEIGAWAERARPRLADTTRERRAGVMQATAAFHGFVRGDWEAARGLAVEALELAPESAVHVATAYGTLAHSTNQLGRPDEAVRWATEMSGQLDVPGIDDVLRVGAHSAMAAASLAAGDRTTARVEADAGLRLARRNDQPSQLAVSLFSFALTCEADDPDAALAALEESVELMRAGASDTNFGAALARIARLRDRNADFSGALDVLHEAVAHFQRVGPRAELVVVVAQLARTLAGNGYPEPAATLAGIVAAGPLASMAAIGTPDRVARATAAARTQLGDTAYDAAFARGAAMTYDDAFAFTRDVLDRAIADAEE